MLHSVDESGALVLIAAIDLYVWRPVQLEEWGFQQWIEQFVVVKRSKRPRVVQYALLLSCPLYATHAVVRRERKHMRFFFDFEID